MPTQIENIYYVGKDMPYTTVNQAINTIASAIATDNYSFPPGTSPDGGNVNIVLVGNGTFPPITIPDNLTVPLAAAGIYLVIKRQEFTENGTLVSNSLPVITPMAQNGSEISQADKLIGINIGSNNPNVKIIGLRISGFVIGLVASANSNNLNIHRSFFTNSINTQVYVHDINGLYFTNNIVIGGQYGVVCKYTKSARLYHNSIILDGVSALNNQTKAGVIVQGERTLNNTSPSKVYFLGNIVYTIGCPAGIFYEEDLKTHRLVSDYNDWYSQDTVIQLRQDNATLPDDTSEVIKSNYSSLLDWKRSGPLGNTNTKIDQNSISVHPQFIQNVSLLSNSLSSILNLGTIDNSPIMQKVPSWYYSTDSLYIPSDFDNSLISTDSLLNTRDQPFTSIGANDKASVNGFFGQDIFTSPFSLDPSKKCDLDPLNVISAQELLMTYPSIKAGYFWSHDRPYYLYGKKFAAPLGYIARTKFSLPGVLKSDSVKVSIRDVEIPVEDWDLVGSTLYVFHKNHGIKSYYDEIQVSGKVKRWYNNGFAYEDSYYIFKINDGITEFVLPKDYVSTAPIVITNDNVNYLNPSDLTRAEFTTEFIQRRNETKLVFGGNENLFDNSDFSSFTTGNVPAGWIAPVQTGQSGVFMLWNQYAYYGDYAVALRLDGPIGSLTSQKVAISQDDNLSITWHARAPVDITGSAGLLTGCTGYFFVNFYDNYDELMPYQVSGSFMAGTTGYNRYYLPLGAVDTLISPNLNGLDSAPLMYISTGAIGMPDNVTKFDFTLSGANYGSNIMPGSFIVIDAIQAEYSAMPSYYHPKPGFNTMTIECETDPSGVYTDTRLNISSVINENPNGFLSIVDMPATIWGGPHDPEVTTLHEHRWPHGRINVMPWARLFGKDKLKQKAILSNQPAYIQDVIVPFVFPRGAAEAIMTPSVVYCNQDSDNPEGFHVQILDKFNNPYALRGYVAHVYDPQGQFPGWLSKRYYGAKEQLGTTVYGKLNSNGSFAASYLSPSSRHIRWVGSVPTPLVQSGVNSIAIVETSYNCSLTSNANITIIGQSGIFHKVNATEPLTGQYYADTNKDQVFIQLDYPPVFGTVELTIDSVQYFETQGIPQSTEFYIDYPAAQIKLSSSVVAGSQSLVSYRPRYAYPSVTQPNRIILHTDKIFGNYSGPIQIDYDAEVKLEVRVADPLDREFVATFPVVLQNPQLGYFKENISSFEF
jgi:hypothetical protein